MSIIKVAVREKMAGIDLELSAAIIKVAAYKNQIKEIDEAIEAVSYEVQALENDRRQLEDYLGAC